MDGFDALRMPGTDHAGIATQNVKEGASWPPRALIATPWAGRTLSSGLAVEGQLRRALSSPS